MNANNRPSILWQNILIVLMVIDGILLFLIVISMNLKASTLHNMGLIDLFVSLIILLVFIWKIKENKTSKVDFLKNNWTDIIAFIPIYFIVSEFGMIYPHIFIKILIVVKLVAMYLFIQENWFRCHKISGKNTS